MKLLFVCTGNTCRSPMAQGLAKLYFPSEVEVISAGINALEGVEASLNAVKVLQEKGIDISVHKAVRLTKDMIASADHVLTMTKSQKEYLSSNHPEFSEKIKCLGHMSSPEKEVSDPWGGSITLYRRCAAEIAQQLETIAFKLNGTDL